MSAPSVSNPSASRRTALKALGLGRAVAGARRLREYDRTCDSTADTPSSFPAALGQAAHLGAMPSIGSSSATARIGPADLWCGVIRSMTKTVVHNYGHGGGGLSLAWGSSALALRELGTTPSGDVAVLGSGVMGLTTARLLQDAGARVTIYTREVARHTTSNIAGGQWAPYSVYDDELVDETFLTRFEWAARIAHHAYANLVGAGYGVSWIEQYMPRSDRGYRGARPPGRSLPLRRPSLPGQHPFSAPHVYRNVTLRIEPGILLRRLEQDFRLAGGRLEIRTFNDLDDVLSLEEPVVFNCLGLGAGEVFGDDGLMPAKGQLVLLPPDPGVDYFTLGGGRGNLYLFSRSDSLLLGGTFEKGNWSPLPDPAETERIVSEHQRIFSRLQGLIAALRAWAAEKCARCAPVWMLPTTPCHGLVVSGRAYLLCLWARFSGPFGMTRIGCGPGKEHSA